MARPTYVQDIKYIKTSVKKKYDPLKSINKKENQEHRINYEAIHDGLVRTAIKQNQQMEADQGWSNTNYDSLYGTEIIKTENRAMEIRWVNIPTFTHENKAQYYTAFFVNIDWYKVTDMKQIHALCLQQIDQRLMEGQGKHGNRGRYTIFLAGKMLGRTNFLRWNTVCRQLHVFMVNTSTAKGNIRSCVDVRQGVFKTLANLFHNKLARMKQSIEEGWHYYNGKRNQHNLYGNLQKDFKRLKGLMEELKETFFSYRKRYWRIKKKMAAERERDTNSVYSNNIRKQTEQYQKLMDSVNSAMKSAEKTCKQAGCVVTGG